MLDLANIEGDEIVIRIKISSLEVAFDLVMDDDTDVKLTNSATFARGVVQELNAENEKGDTLVHKMLDQAVREAVEQGAERLSYGYKND